MKKTLIITLFYVFFSHSAFASLDGEWGGQEFILGTIKIRNIGASSFAAGSNTVIFKGIDKTISISDGLGTFNGNFTQKVTIKYGLVLKHTFNAQFNKTELANLLSSSLSSELGPDLIISNMKVSTANAKGEEFNEIEGENIDEDFHALHGSYKISATFKIAESANPSYKLSGSLIFDVDIGEFRPSEAVVQQQSFPQSNDSIVVQQQSFLQSPRSIFQETAKKIKALFDKQAKP
jgi:hypothetical protein